MQTLYKCLNLFKPLQGVVLSKTRHKTLPIFKWLRIIPLQRSFSGLNTTLCWWVLMMLMFVHVVRLNANDKIPKAIAPFVNFSASDYTCNTKMPWISSDFTGLEAVLVDPAVGGLCTSLLGNGNSGLSNLVDNDLTNFATITFVGIGCNSTLSVRDNDVADTYAAGSFAGFRIGTAGLVGLSIGATITISTRNNGIATGESYEVVNNLLELNSSLLNGDNTATVGFITTLPFDEIRITYQALIGAFTGTVYHAVVQRFCAGPSLACNTQTRMNNPTFPTAIDHTNTGISGTACLDCSVNNAERAVSSSSSDYATIVMDVAVNTVGSIAVKDQITDYPAGTFAGFDIENPGLVGVDLFSGITIQTYYNGNFREQSTASTLLSVSSALLAGTGRQTVGFVTTMSFDEVKIEWTNLLGVLSTTRVYAAVFQSFCVGSNLACNTPTTISTPAHPVLINGVNTEITGVACAVCSIDSTQNLIDNLPGNSARIDLTAGVGAVGSISVKNQLTDYPLGTFAGFEIENTALLDVSLLAGITVSTYLNGTFVESKTGTGALLSVNTGLLTNNGRRTVGFVTTGAFDEVKISVSNTLIVNLGITRVFSLVLQRFCPVVLECNTTNYLNNPDFPVIINDERTGLDGLACIVCSVESAANVISSSNTDYATITTTIDALAPASISVKDVLTTFPAGSTAGFVIRDVNTILQLELFNSITISTYNNGVFQESRSGSNLLDLALLNLLNITLTGANDYNIGFRTTLPYDEIQISVGALASVINIIRVYGAFVDTRGADDANLDCCPKTAPLLSANSISNICPIITVNLNSLVTNFPPMSADTMVRWFTNNTATGNHYATPATAGAGTYYAFFYDTVDSCYGPASGAVTVIIVGCPPIITTMIQDTVPENTIVIGSFTATDPEGDVVKFKITGGVDAIHFEIDSVTGVMSFKVAPDYENPIDNGNDNTYHVQVSGVDEGGQAGVYPILIYIEDLPESVALSAKVFLQGALFNSSTPGVMQDDLRLGNHIPLQDPYTNSGNPRFIHHGLGALESTTSAVLVLNAGNNNAIVDWVFIELRSPLDSSVVVETRAALLQRDGDIVSPLDGVSPISFLGTLGLSYFVSIKHRNHLGVMTSSPRLFNDLGAIVDFSTMSNAQIFNKIEGGYDGHEMVMIDGVKALWAGNANGDGKVKYEGLDNDLGAILAEVLAFGANTSGFYNYDLALGYFFGDIDMDGKVKYQGVGDDTGFVFVNIITNFLLNTADLYNYDLFIEQIP